MFSKATTHNAEDIKKVLEYDSARSGHEWDGVVYSFEYTLVIRTGTSDQMNPTFAIFQRRKRDLPFLFLRHQAIIQDFDLFNSLRVLPLTLTGSPAMDGDEHEFLPPSVGGLMINLFYPTCLGLFSNSGLNFIMGRVKLPISRILNNTNRQVTYSKRRNGILKKAYEIAVLCDIDIALIMISPSGRISFFSGTRRIEDVMLQYFHLSDEEKELDQDSEGLVNDRECVISTLMRLKAEAGVSQSPRHLSSHTEGYRKEIINLQHQLEMAKEQLRVLEPDPQRFTSLNELESCEELLSKTLSIIEQRKKTLLNNHASSYQETVEQIQSVVRYIMNAQAERTPSTLMNPEFSSWPDDGNKHVMNGPNSIHVVSDASPIFQENQSSATVVGSGSQPSADHADKQNAEDCQMRSINEECLQQWHNPADVYPSLVPQGMPLSLNEIDSSTAASITPVLQHNQVESPSQLP
ncbi:hypothetical protein M9H77_19791 [Catharanthus roseus]|uniref:Uncharacterized protein n=1 Tax=Catharanthus roseus TaxID=4058 RepID=A0ACC0BBK6_CATRO|nr:hypothetical protein M9H77_19791 [Catharanthus roseus]